MTQAGQRLRWLRGCMDGLAWGTTIARMRRLSDRFTGLGEVLDPRTRPPVSWGVLLERVAEAPVANPPAPPEADASEDSPAVGVVVPSTPLAVGGASDGEDDALEGGTHGERAPVNAAELLADLRRAPDTLEGLLAWLVPAFDVLANAEIVAALVPYSQRLAALDVDTLSHLGRGVRRRLREIARRVSLAAEDAGRANDMATLVGPSSEGAVRSDQPPRAPPDRTPLVRWKRPTGPTET